MITSRVPSIPRAKLCAFIFGSRKNRYDSGKKTRFGAPSPGGTLRF